MERAIKFRGKSIDNGEWVYGDLIQLDTHLCIAGVHQWAGVPANNSIEIDVTKIVTESVGQFTGLKDKNGVEIYEGDIVEHTISGNISVHEVYFDNEMLEFGLRYSGELFHCQFNDEFELVGNIYDNPEMIEFKEQQKQALIDTMRGDEEIGLYDDNSKNHGYDR